MMDPEIAARICDTPRHNSLTLIPTSDPCGQQSWMPDIECTFDRQKPEGINSLIPQVSSQDSSAARQYVCHLYILHLLYNLDIRLLGCLVQLVQHALNLLDQCFPLRPRIWIALCLNAV